MWFCDCLTSQGTYTEEVQQCLRQMSKAETSLISWVSRNPRCTEVHQPWLQERGDAFCTVIMKLWRTEHCISSCWCCFLDAQAALGNAREKWKNFFCYIWITFVQKNIISEESQRLFLCCCLKEGGEEFIETPTRKQVGCKAAPLGR